MTKKRTSDDRQPVLEKIGCYFECGDGTSGYHFFKTENVSDGDIFIHNKGILWRVKV